MPRYPFPSYPNSWYAVAWSTDVAKGQAKPVRYFGRNLVVFRGEDGAARVLDATCPHMGANLGVNGKVVGNTLQCPFHAWRFDGEGTCVQIPYAPRIPPKAAVRSWPVAERNGAILVYFHEQNDAPNFEVPAIPQFGARGWDAMTLRTTNVRSHVQEMNENVYDLAHFVYVHHFVGLPQAEITEDGALARVALTGTAITAGMRWGGQIINTMYGAGVLTIHIVMAMEFIVYVYKTPVDDENVEHRYGISLKDKFGPLGRLAKPHIVSEVTRDVMTDRRIWESKEFLEQPLLVKGDGQIMRFRKWHSQFYTPTTVPLRIAAQA